MSDPSKPIDSRGQAMLDGLRLIGEAIQNSANAEERIAIRLGFDERQHYAVLLNALLDRIEALEAALRGDEGTA